jgi:hypothetical protein
VCMYVRTCASVCARMFGRVRVCMVCVCVCLCVCAVHVCVVQLLLLH